MPRERTRTPATRGKSKPKDTSANGAPEQGPANGVLVLRSCDEEGNIGVQVQRLGDVKVTEIQTILELGLRQMREQLEL